jgi:NTP pyrophosphatase (non-canonical NTP hydrolase)
MRSYDRSLDTSFEEIYDTQMSNQEMMLRCNKYDSFSDECKGCGKYTKMPHDDVRLASYHIQQLMSEVGEVLDADKRWKNFRNEKYDRESKLEEIADCFIVLMNIAMFSGFSGHEVASAILKKIDVVCGRILKEVNNK